MIAHRSQPPATITHAGFHRMIVPTDFGEATEHAVDAALVLARQLDAEVVLIHVFHVTPVAYAPGMFIPYDELRSGAQKALGLAVSKLKERYPKVVGEIVEGEPWQEILAAANRCHADLIVMGTSGRQGLPRFFLGSVAEKVLRVATVPVMVLSPQAMAPG